MASVLVETNPTPKYNNENAIISPQPRPLLVMFWRLEAQAEPDLQVIMAVTTFLYPVEVEAREA